MTAKKQETENLNSNLLTTESRSCHLRSSAESLSESEDDLSFSLSAERELSVYTNCLSNDELPAFEIRLMSPMGRSPSPIDNEAITSERGVQDNSELEQFTPSPCRYNSTEYVALQDINAQISPPSDNEETLAVISHTSSLETIFEGVFLNTPPRHRLRQNSRSCTNLLEKVVANRLNFGKENQKSPHTQEASPHQLKQQSQIKSKPPLHEKE